MGSWLRVGLPTGWLAAGLLVVAAGIATLLDWRLRRCSQEAMNTLELVVAASLLTGIPLSIALDLPTDVQSLGMPQLIVIFVTALVLFGPRRPFRHQ